MTGNLWRALQPGIRERIKVRRGAARSGCTNHLGCTEKRAGAQWRRATSRAGHRAQHTNSLTQTRAWRHRRKKSLRGAASQLSRRESAQRPVVPRAPRAETWACRWKYAVSWRRQRHARVPGQTASVRTAGCARRKKAHSAVPPNSRHPRRPSAPSSLENTEAVAHTARCGRVACVGVNKGGAQTAQCGPRTRCVRGTAPRAQYTTHREGICAGRARSKQSGALEAETEVAQV